MRNSVAAGIEVCDDSCVGAAFIPLVECRADFRDLVLDLDLAEALAFDGCPVRYDGFPFRPFPKR